MADVSRQRYESQERSGGHPHPDPDQSGNPDLSLGSLFIARRHTDARY